MGVGRRMKKQGPPPPLDESLVTRKRKAVPATNGLAKKQKTQSVDGFTKAKNLKPLKPANSAAQHSTKGNFTKGKSTQADKSALLDVQEKFFGKPKKQLLPLNDGSDAAEDDISDGVGSSDDFNDASDGIDDPDVLEDELGDLNSQADDVSEDGDLGDGVDEFDISGSDVVDSDIEPTGGLWSDDDDNAEEALTAANIEGLSSKLDAKAAQDAADAQAELEEQALQTNIANERPNVLEDDSEDGNQRARSLLAPNLQLLRTRITDNIRILTDFTKLSEPGRSRAEYTTQLLKDVCAYYDYSEFLAEKLFNLFTPAEAFAFFEANETPRPVVIRTNTLRTHRRDLAQALINRGVILEPVGKWTKVGLQIFESQVPLGATPEYLAGHYILQAASSFLPVIALAPQEHERVLDMASAPGGKVTHMAALMRNTGFIFANDSNKARAKALIGNIHRMGAKNIIVSNHDAREFPKVIGGFDRVLLDAPCSGTGVIAKDASVKTNKTPQDFLRLPHLQKQLLLCAIDSVNHASKTGGYIVYSTCSVTVEENEQVVQYALNKRPNVRLVETGITFGKEGFTNFMNKKFHPSMKETRRYYPHAYNVDGFFVARFQKIGPTPANAVASGVTNGTKIDAGNEELPDRTPVPESEDGDGANKDDDFGGWDDEEDAAYIERAKKQLLRKKGLHPKSERLAGDRKTNGSRRKETEER
ncbi:MAG: rRNA (cytosine-C5-)-methyltransferase nop2 [Bogoriella megaspora]|nr:MAG: rRNA (cytosine-C5-)-methyltransferase nop2 [Bogoriella megaspora]